jgi:hypothetical protein
MAEPTVPALVAKRRWIGFDPFGVVQSRARRRRPCSCIADQRLSAAWPRERDGAGAVVTDLTVFISNLRH